MGMTNTNSSRGEDANQGSGSRSTGDGRTFSTVLGVATTVVTTVYTATQSLGATAVAALLTLVLDRRIRKADR